MDFFLEDVLRFFCYLVGFTIVKIITFGKIKSEPLFKEYELNTEIYGSLFYKKEGRYYFSRLLFEIVGLVILVILIIFILYYFGKNHINLFDKQ
jgi:uncharacterized membrane protein